MVLKKNYFEFFFLSRLPEVSPLLQLTIWHFSDPALSQRLLRALTTDTAQACERGERSITRHNHVQTCRGTLAVCPGNLMATPHIMGAPGI